MASQGAATALPAGADLHTLEGTRVAAFSEAQLAQGELPPQWQLHVTRPDRPRTRYGLTRRDGRQVIHAVAEGSTSGLRHDLHANPHQTPWLSWSWRVDEFPAQATVAEDDLEDTPARVIVAFGGGDESQLSLRDLLFSEQVALFTGRPLPFATLVYVWDGLAPVESVLRYPRSSRIRYLVVQSGAAGVGGWHNHRRHLIDDYRRVFGAEPGPITSLGLMCDSDDLGGRSEAWFGDLGLGGPILA